MSEDKLSREELIALVKEWTTGHGEYSASDREIHAYVQIKSLLTPIPEEKLGWLKELINEVRLSLKFNQKFYPNDRMFDNLQELYDALKEGKEE